MIGFQRLVVEYIEPGMADVARLQRVDQRLLVGERAARGVDEQRTGLHARDALAAQEAARLVVEHEVERNHVGAGEQRVDVDQRAGRVAPRRAVIGDDLHAEALGHARHFGADAAEADDAERLAEQLDTLLRRPLAAAHVAVHARNVACGRKHQRDRVLGDGRVAVALDDVDGDAALF